MTELFVGSVRRKELTLTATFSADVGILPATMGWHVKANKQQAFIEDTDLQVFPTVDPKFGIAVFVFRTEQLAADYLCMLLRARIVFEAKPGLAGGTVFVLDPSHNWKEKADSVRGIAPPNIQKGLDERAARTRVLDAVAQAQPPVARAKPAEPCGACWTYYNVGGMGRPCGRCRI